MLGKNLKTMNLGQVCTQQVRYAMCLTIVLRPEL